MKPASVATIAVWSTSVILKLASPPFGRLVKEQAALDGQYRYVHSRLITNSEEVAFYGGHEVELSVLQVCVQKLPSREAGGTDHTPPPLARLVAM